MRGMALLLTVVILSAFSVRAEEKMSQNVYDYTLDDIDGKKYDLSKHKGEVLLIVNVASKCGLTPQYNALEKVYQSYKGKGLTVIGVPANEFGAQEPGTNDEIKTFCSTKYKVTFPLMAKAVVKGDGICPLYKMLTTASPKPGAIGWNFAKFLVNRKGEVIERFDPKVAPDDAIVSAAIEAALKAPK